MDDFKEQKAYHFLSCFLSGLSWWNGPRLSITRDNTELLDKKIYNFADFFHIYKLERDELQKMQLPESMELMMLPLSITSSLLCLFHR